MKGGSAGGVSQGGVNFLCQKKLGNIFSFGLCRDYQGAFAFTVRFVEGEVLFKKKGNGLVVIFSNREMKQVVSPAVTGLHVSPCLVQGTYKRAVALLPGNKQGCFSLAVSGLNAGPGFEQGGHVGVARLLNCRHQGCLAGPVQCREVEFFCNGIFYYVGTVAGRHIMGR